MSEPAQTETSHDSGGDRGLPKLTGRRSFLRWMTHLLGTAFAAVLAFPSICFLIDPRNRKASSSGFRNVAKIDEIPADGRVLEAVVTETRRDAWNLMPNEVIGRIFLVRRGEPRDDDPGIEAFSTVCPHLGCSVNYVPTDAKAPFQCPCHGGRFTAEGKRIEPNPAKRDMLKLRVRRNPADPTIIQVEYRGFSEEDFA